MADVTSTKIVSLERLGQYDGLIKKYITDADKVVDAKSVKNVAVVGDNIYFFKQDTIPTTEGGAIDTSKASATVAISSSDVAQLLEDVAELQGTVTGYSSTSTIASAISAAQTAAEGHADTAVQTLADGAVATNTAAIAAINNTETGILKTAKDYTDALENGQVKTNKEAIEAINDGTTGILKTAENYTDTEVKKVTDSIGTVPTGSTVIAEIAAAKKAGTDAQSDLDSYKTTNDAAVAAAKKAGDDAQADVDSLEGVVGDMSAVKTTAKTVAGAVDELYDAIDSAESAGAVTITDATTPTEGYLKTYVFTQNNAEIGKIDIPKDLVVTSGEVVVDPEGQPAGTYVKLTIANQTDPIYINVADLVDVYTPAAGATQVQVAISDTNEVSATLVAGGVGTTELAAGAVTTAKIADANVTTAKIADKNVTKAKLADDVQTSLGLADSAVQSIATGSADGTISVDGADVAVKGLGSAAYTDSTAYDAAGDAAQALADAKTYADDLYAIATTTEISDLFKDAE